MTSEDAAHSFLQETLEATFKVKMSRDCGVREEENQSWHGWVDSDNFDSQNGASGDKVGRR